MGSRWRPDMTDDELAAELAGLRADPELTAWMAAAPRELAPNEAARVARLLWPRQAASRAAAALRSQ
jgi:hypothetical protein